MKFYQVALQQRFFYRDELYIKTGPLTATCTSTQKTMLLARHATISLVDGESAEDIQKPILLEPQQVQQALQLFHQAISEAIADIKLQPEQLSRLDAELEKHWSMMLDTLNLHQ